MCPEFGSLCKCCELPRVLSFGVGPCSVPSVPGTVGMSPWEFPVSHVQCNLLKLPPVEHKGVLRAECHLKGDLQADLWLRAVTSLQAQTSSLRSGCARGTGDGGGLEFLGIAVIFQEHRRAEG